MVDFCHSCRSLDGLKLDLLFMSLFNCSIIVHERSVLFKC